MNRIAFLPAFPVPAVKGLWRLAMAFPLLAIAVPSVNALDSVFPMTTTPPAGWALSALNGIKATDVGSDGPDVIAADGGTKLRIRAGTVVSMPFTTSASYTPDNATNLEYKYDLSAFAGDEIAFGTRFRVVGYASADEPGADCVMSVSLPGGPGIALVLGHTGSGKNADIPGSRTDSGFHLYQYRASTGQISPNVTGGNSAVSANLQGSTRKLADLLVYPAGGISSNSTSWDTAGTYHTFWLYVNKANGRIVAQVDNLAPVDMALLPLKRQFTHDSHAPFSDLLTDLNTYSMPLTGDWDSTGFAQFGARDYDVHAELPEWVPLGNGYYNWQPGETSPTPYGSTDSRYFYGGNSSDGIFNGNAAVLTTDMSKTPFQSLVQTPVGEELLDGGFEQGGGAWTTFASGGEMNTPSVLNTAGVNVGAWHPTGTSCGSFSLADSQQLHGDGSYAGVYQEVRVRPGFHYTLTGQVGGGVTAGTGLWEVGIIKGVWDPAIFANPNRILAFSKTLTGMAQFDWGVAPFADPFFFNFVTDANEKILTVYARYKLDGGAFTDFGAYFDCLSLKGPIVHCNRPFADADGDTDVDMDDFGLFQRCFSGAGAMPPDDGSGHSCSCLDRDGNDMIDQGDFNQFFNCATGAGVPWSQGLTPNCSP